MNAEEVHAHVARQWRAREEREDAILVAAERVLEKRRTQNKYRHSMSSNGVINAQSIRMLPKYTEPPRPMCHWDHVVAEVVWVSKEYVRERKWKKAKARQFSGLAATKAMRNAMMKTMVGTGDVLMNNSISSGTGNNGDTTMTMLQSLSPFGKFTYENGVSVQMNDFGAYKAKGRKKNGVDFKGHKRGQKGRLGNQEGGSLSGGRKRTFQVELLKEVERARRRIWSDTAKRVIAFWGKAQRVVEWKIRKDMEKERSAMLNDKLDKLVGETEKISRELAVEIGVGRDEARNQIRDAGQEQDMGEAASQDEAEEEEYVPSFNDEDDDEEATLIAEELNEALDKPDHQDEINVLAQEAEMPLDKLIELYNMRSEEDGSEELSDRDASNQKDVEDELQMPSTSVDDVFEEVDGDNEFEIDSEDDINEDEDEEDFDRAIREEEMVALANGERPHSEIHSLQAEADMPIEELKRMYGVDNVDEENNNDDSAEPTKQEQDLPSSSGGNVQTVDVTANNVDHVFTEVEGDSDYESISGSEYDDEATLEEEERLARLENDDDSEDDEIRRLREEADMPIEELRQSLGVSSPVRSDGIVDVDSEEFDDDSDDFAMDDDEDNEYNNNSEDSDRDDEGTMEEEERLAQLERQTSTDDEIDTLQNEANMSIDELMRLYNNNNNNNNNVDSVVKEDGEAAERKTVEVVRPSSNRFGRAGNTENGNTADADVAEDDEDGEHGVEDESDTDEIDLKSLYEGSYENRINSISKNAMEAQPTGYTLETTNVKTKVPFLLKHTLREYQHIGLDWLVSMYEKKLNGILADEMGLGKTIMTISLLSWLACERGIWGPHLIVVPTSVIINWEMEFKKWAPGFKLLVYFGNAKERKIKRQGWSKQNAFHVCITTYTLVIQDSKAFRRKKWQYLILDEAHLIKNWRSLRWQTLLNYHSRRRILITGTPLQNDLMELWSLLHFLMPKVFGSHAEFRELFSNPLTGAVEGTKDLNKALVSRLHGVLRPFLLRRLKSQVEKQLPGKFEHVVKCPMSRRQKRLYEEYMSSVGTQSTLASGNYLGIINVLMQLRKCCNHPDLFAGRAIISSFDMQPVKYSVPSIVPTIYKEFKSNNFNRSEFMITDNETLTTWDADLCDIKDIAGTDADVSPATFEMKRRSVDPFTIWNEYNKFCEMNWRRSRSALQDCISARRCMKGVIYGSNLIKTVTTHGQLVDTCFRSMHPRFYLTFVDSLRNILLSHVDRARQMEDIIKHFTFMIPRARTTTPVMLCSKPEVDLILRSARKAQWAQKTLSMKASFLRPSAVRMQLFFPDRRLVQFDCGKLQQLALLLRKLMSGGHKVLIFTQMTKMLDVLENFLNLYGYTYLRLDGSTKPEQRQILMQRFNTNPKLFAFILSTRSGGVGINLTGADTVIFYDSDWNPAMDQQAQDRCHRIGQTREVHIYRLITENTIEENILKKSDQKRKLDHLAIQSGSFTTDFLAQGSFGEILGSDLPKVNVSKMSEKEIEKAFQNAEDDDDVIAMKKAKEETVAEMDEFNNNEPNNVPDNTNNNGNASLKTEDGKIQTVDAPPDDILSQLSPVERYAVRFVEETGIFVLPSFLSIKPHQQGNQSNLTIASNHVKTKGDKTAKENGKLGTVSIGDSDDDEDDGKVDKTQWDPASAITAYQAEVRKVNCRQARYGDANGLAKNAIATAKESLQVFATKRKRDGEVH